MKTNPLRLTAMAAALAVVLSAGSYSLGGNHAIKETQAASQPAVALAPAPVAALPDMAGIVSRNGPAVVNISVAGTRKAGRDMPDFSGIDPEGPLGDLFRHFGVPRQQGEGGAPVRGLGSGFIVSADGVILTNTHVIDGADEVTVKLSDRREFKARVLGMDKASDVAVLKIDAKDLPVVRIGRAANTRVGEWVLAIGSPFGLDNSASAGIVSAKARSLPDGSYVPFIQTDVAVNPGNSGGPLFNMAGEVVGINSQIYSRSGGYQGLSFAIPIEVAMNVQQQIVTNGKVQRGKLGVTIQEVNQSLAETFGLKKPAGALVSSVERGSPAEKAGLESGDVILAINEQEITASSELSAAVANVTPGDNVRLKVWRKGAPRDIAVRVGAFGDEKLAASAQPEAAKGRLGVVVRDLSPEERRRAESAGGVLVQDVAGAAARAGIRPGDVVLSVNGEAVASSEQLQKLIAKAAKRVAVLVERGDARIFIPVDLG